MRDPDCRALAHYLDEYLAAREVSDYCPNGLQVEGERVIRKVVTGVSACRELFERAIAAGADAVLVHHGLFWEGDSRTLTGVQYRRVAPLVRSGMGLLAYHLPLDRHLTVGNNAVAAKRLGLYSVEPFAVHKGVEVGVKGRFPEPVAARELVERCREVFAREPLAFLHGPDPISTVGMVSGGAQRDVHQALAEGLDAFITGEVSEWVMNLVREAGIHYLSCGHHATERFGVQALGEHLAERFGIEAEFIDIPNPA